MVMGAYGAALMVSKVDVKQTRFRGYDLCLRTIITQSFECDDCPNQCEVVELMDDGRLISRSGGRCRKWEGDLSDR